MRIETKNTLVLMLKPPVLKLLPGIASYQYHYIYIYIYIYIYNMSLIVVASLYPKYRDSSPAVDVTCIDTTHRYKHLSNILMIHLRSLYPKTRDSRP